MNPTNAICRFVAIRSPFERTPNLICNISDIKLITTTVRAQAANELRDRILTGRLQPGDRLDLDQLTAEFGISRAPIREPLLQLSYARPAGRRRHLPHPRPPRRQSGRDGARPHDGG